MKLAVIEKMEGKKLKQFKLTEKDDGNRHRKAPVVDEKLEMKKFFLLFALFFIFSRNE